MPVNPLPEQLQFARIAKIVPIALILAMAASAIWVPAAVVFVVMS